MLEEGKIDASQAAELLKAVDSSEPNSQASDQAETNGGTSRRGKWLVVKVTDKLTGKKKVNVRVPTAIIRSASKIAGRYGNLNLRGIEIDNIEELLNAGAEGMIADVTDEEGNEHVEVYLE